MIVCDACLKSYGKTRHAIRVDVGGRTVELCQTHEKEINEAVNLAITIFLSERLNARPEALIERMRPSEIKDGA